MKNQKKKVKTKKSPKLLNEQVAKQFRAAEEQAFRIDLPDYYK
jgi:hypothetical protein